MVTTIQLDNEVRLQLDSLKIHRETYNDLLLRILNDYSVDEIDRESLIATIEVLSDSELMKGIGEALGEVEREERGVSWEKIKKDLDLNV